MIYVLTVHWQDPSWIDTQRKMLQRYINQPFKLIGYLNGIDSGYYESFDRVVDMQDKGHAEKLNELAELVITEGAREEDWLIFLDGDAFPVRNVVECLTPFLEEYPLVAIKRVENLGEQQPHPSFCATTVGFWKSNSCNWNMGYQWINSLGEPDTDVGGNLLGILIERGMHWKTLLRTNSINKHPVFFGIYGDVVYHHGAGFRKHKVPRISSYNAGAYGNHLRFFKFDLLKIVPKNSKIRSLMIYLTRESTIKRRLNKEITNLSKQIKERVREDPECVREMFGPEK